MKLNNKNKIVVKISLLALILVSMIGCSSKKETYNNIDGKQTQELINNTEDLLVVDVRSKEDYDNGHIEGSINIPYDEFESRISEIEEYKDKTVLLYCTSGNKSEKDSKILAKKGFKNVYNATDGVAEYDYKLVK